MGLRKFRIYLFYNNTKNENYCRLLSFLVLYIIFLFTTCAPIGKTPPKAEKGVLDLRDWNFDTSTSLLGGNINLDGEWEFYWNEFPEGKDLSLPDGKREYLEVPNSWKGAVVKQSNGSNEIINDRRRGVGYATYKLKILIGKDLPLSMRLSDQGTAYTLYVNNKEILKSGSIGKTEEDSIPNRDIEYINLTPENGELNILLSISNFHYSSGGFWLSIILGNPKNIHTLNIYKVSLDLFISGILFIMGIYHLFHYFLRRADRSPFFFGLFCLLLALRNILTGERFFLHLFPDIDFNESLRLEYLTFYLSSPLFAEFINSLYPKEMNQLLRKINLIFFMILSLMVLLLPPLYFTSTILFAQTIVLLSIIYIIYILVKAHKSKKEGAHVFLYGFIIFSIVMINDILHSNYIINTGLYTPFGFVALIFSQSFLLISRFTSAFQQAMDLSQNLETKVEERTQNLEFATKTLERANQEILESRKVIEELNEMIQVIIQSKSTDEIFEKIFDLFSERYGLTTYLVYILDKNDGYIKLYKHYGNANFEKDYRDIINKNKFSIDDNFSILKKCITNNKSFWAKNVRLPHPCKPEEENLKLAGIESFYIVPLSIDNASFGTIIFSNNKYQFSNVKNLKKPEREEIESFIKLISPSIYQSLQKNIIEKAFLEIQLTKDELSNQKAQLERLQAMSQEIQRKTNFEDMLISLEQILWDSYHIEDYLLVTQNTENNLIEFYAMNQNLKRQGFDKKLKSISLKEERSLHRLIFEKKRSLYLPKLKNTSNGEEEDFNRNLLGMQSYFAIPCIINDETFAVLSFSDISPEYSRDPISKGVKNLTYNQRMEIEQLVTLIANALYQSLQKTKIGEAYHHLQETQAQLMEAERLASLGQLVGGIAHEINNPISVIRSQSEFLRSNINSTLYEIPIFLESLTQGEKEIFYDIVNNSLKTNEFLTSREERSRKKEIQKEITKLVNSTDEVHSYITEQILLLRLKPPYELYLEKLGLDKWKKFLSIAQIFKNQTNFLSNIEISVEKASRVVFALRSYLNTELNLHKSEVDLVKEIEKAFHVYDNYIIGKMTVKKEYPKELKYNCVAENFTGVWKNIIFNAVQATYNTQKKLEVKLEKVDSLPERLKSYRASGVVDDKYFQYQGSNPWVLVSFQDWGVGIKEELQNKVFTPFFTTKSLGEGIGLGLYVCKKIVSEHKGLIFFNSREGTTEFIVALPDTI